MTDTLTYAPAIRLSATHSPPETFESRPSGRNIDRSGDYLTRLVHDDMFHIERQGSSENIPSAVADRQSGLNGANLGFAERFPVVADISRFDFENAAGPVAFNLGYTEVLVSAEEIGFAAAHRENRIYVLEALCLQRFPIVDDQRRWTLELVGLFIRHNVGNLNIFMSPEHENFARANMHHSIDRLKPCCLEGWPIVGNQSLGNENRGLSRLVTDDVPEEHEAVAIEEICRPVLGAETTLFAHVVDGVDDVTRGLWFQIQSRV